MDVVWETPKNDAPAAEFRGETVAGRRVKLMQEVESNPGRWARVSDHKTRNAAHQVKRKIKKLFPDHEYRVETQDGRAVLFAMYPPRQEAGQ